MTLQQCLAQLADPRRAQGRRYELTPLLIGILLAIACGVTSYRKVHAFLANHWQRVIAVFGGRWKQAPAYTTVRNVLRELEPGALEAVFRAHSQALLAAQGEDAGRCIAIDGKVLRGSVDHFADQRAAQLLGALAQSEQLIVAHVPIAEDSNEIPAAQQLIAELEQAGCLLTLDAEHCQKKPFEAAEAHGHDLLVQVKGNQPSLRRAVAHLAQTAPALDQHTQTDLDRRRHTQRTLRVFAAQGLPGPWTAHLAAVVQVQRLTDAFCTQTGRWRRTHETRYYVCSRLASAAVFATAIRGHWGIENRVHYVKDVTLREDASRLRQHPGIFARIVFHYTPKHCSWLNPIEIGLSILVRKLLQRGSFPSVDDLKTQVLAFIAYYNQTMAKPFKWTYQGKPLVA
jgi:predicted transposase YbfD/YdcC